mmetsp:Transcript_51673/g.159984  ORF Transcript_51673/g.159984 Transcript_51673/m.159984 type:complete len:425 (+) Transcript_51673:42-1316(+)
MPQSDGARGGVGRVALERRLHRVLEGGERAEVAAAAARDLARHDAAVEEHAHGGRAGRAGGAPELEDDVGPYRRPLAVEEAEGAGHGGHDDVVARVKGEARGAVALRLRTQTAGDLLQEGLDQEVLCLGARAAARVAAAQHLLGVADELHRLPGLHAAAFPGAGQAAPVADVAEHAVGLAHARGGEDGAVVVVVVQGVGARARAAHHHLPALLAVELDAQRRPVHGRLHVRPDETGEHADRGAQGPLRGRRADVGPLRVELREQAAGGLPGVGPPEVAAELHHHLEASGQELRRPAGRAVLVGAGEGRQGLLLQRPAGRGVHDLRELGGGEELHHELLAEGAGVPVRVRLVGEGVPEGRARSVAGDDLHLQQLQALRRLQGQQGRRGAVGDVRVPRGGRPAGTLQEGSQGAPALLRVAASSPCP